ncbi:molybdopterin-dependent oxidoreductase [Actinoplanes derwentensis]|uniref:molybdopterin-dependent oxidoreductase n=1 Tax=Actinoplanes derwentensis TaxID=113562 RepID=UPI000AB0B0D3|nr:molybdopterin-dependent oxidoreductase [Actinoplanes derwentensis]GID88482.1 hypothetical protein Ade03nite_74060 [Actinoplanes derwentensis]
MVGYRDNGIPANGIAAGAGPPLPADHGFPVRAVVPGWVGIASIKWVGRIEVSAEPLFSPWNTQFYRLFGPDFPAEGQPFDRQVIKSAFELDPGTTFPAGVRTRLTGRSWSADGPIRETRVSTDGGVTWRRARPYGATPGGVWQRWELDWTPPRAITCSRPAPPTCAATPSPRWPGSTPSVTCSTRCSTSR